MASPRIMHYAPLIILAVVVIFFFPSFVTLYSVWIIWDQSMSHGMPVAFLFVYLLWSSLPWVSITTWRNERTYAFISIFLFSVAWAISYATKIKIIHELCTLPIYISALVFIFGAECVWKKRVLLTLPIYIIPVWEFMNDYLVVLSSAVVSEWVQLIKMPAYIDGNSIQIPSGKIVIADGCSGLRYFTIALCLPHVIAYLNGYKEKGLLSCMFVAGCLGLLANWLRIFILICVGYMTEMKSPLMADHDTFGWVLFGAICLVAIYFAPIVKTSKTELQQNTQSTISIVSVALLATAVLIGPVLVELLKYRDTKYFQHTVINKEPYEQQVKPLIVDTMLPGPNMEYRYVNKNVLIGLYESIPAVTESKLVPYIPRLYDQNEWRLLENKVIKVNSNPASWKIFESRSSQLRVGQIQWLNVGGHYASTINGAKLLQFPAMLQGNMFFKILTFQAPCEFNTCEETYKVLLEESKNSIWH